MTSRASRSELADDSDGSPVGRSSRRLLLWGGVATALAASGLVIWSAVRTDDAVPLSSDDPPLDSAVPDDPEAGADSAGPDSDEADSTAGSEAVRLVTPTLGIWLTAAEIERLPQEGDAWDAMYGYATDSWGSPAFNDQNDKYDIYVLAGALAAVRLDDRALADRVADALDQVTGSEFDRVLPESRNVVSYVLAADLIGYESQEFSGWLADVLEQGAQSRAGIRSLLESALRDPSNQGAHSRAAALAIGLYLGDDELVVQIASRFRDWLGRTGDGFTFGERSWQADPDFPVGINPAGTVIDGLSVDGVLPDDQRRSGEFSTDPQPENYVWEAMQGATVTAEILSRFGYDAWGWEDEAMRRAVTWLYEVVGYPAEGDDTWQPWIVNRAYAEDFAVQSPTKPGKNMAFADWTHGS